MCGLVRLYVYRNGVTNVHDFEKHEARHRRKELEQDGWVVYHTVEL